ncbi:hypothetical protein [Parafilimonas terrae]|nr:hypothetical protein [Parafilimonas terrae]
MKLPPSTTNLAVAFSCLLLFLFSASCKKNTAITSTRVNSTITGDSIVIKNAGITIKTGILPPVTQKTFIPNGDSSVAEFQVIASKLILLRRMDFSAPSLILSSRISSIYDYKIHNDTGVMTYFIDRYLQPGSGADLIMDIFYKNINKINSGSVAQVSLTGISYVTSEDNMEHYISLPRPVKTEPMCLVRNKPGIMFQNPSGAVLENGFREIMQVKLTGDLKWTLVNLPLSISASHDYNGAVSKCKLIVKNKNEILETESDSVYVPSESTGNTVIHFSKAFQHAAGDTETLKIYAPVSGTLVSLISTMNPYKALVWKDALGTKINGQQNDRFFKEITNFSSFYYQE